MSASAFSYRDGNKSSDSDSDCSDNERRDWKRASGRDNVQSMDQAPIEPTAPPSAPEGNTRVVKRKRNNIWCDVLEDQLMSETLTFCGIKNKPKNFGSRGAESYDYTLSANHKRKFESDGMSDDAMSDASDTKSVSSCKSDTRKRSKFFVPLEKEDANAARMIVHKLGEQKPHIIYRVVKYVGKEKALQLLKETEDIEEKGGMMINNNKRRRTPGGVFIQLLKMDKDVPKEAVDKVFEGEINSFQNKKKFDFIRKKKEAKRMKLEEGKKKVLDELEGIDAKQPDDQENCGDKCESMEQEVVPPIEAVSGSCNPISSDIEDGEIDD